MYKDINKGYSNLTRMQQLALCVFHLSLQCERKKVIVMILNIEVMRNTDSNECLCSA
jgi:hypothetical protein